MGLFDFFKINKKRNYEPENIDEIFNLAAKDITYRPLFYRTILDTNLYLLTVTDEEGNNETSKLKVKNWDDGKIPSLLLQIRFLRIILLLKKKTI